MTLSAVQHTLENGNSPAEAGGYNPETHHPLVFQEDGGGNTSGAYDNYLAMVRSMVDRELRTLGNYVQSGWYAKDRRLRSLVTRYYKLTQWQLTSPAGLMNHGRTQLLKERTSILALLQASELPWDRAEAEQAATREKLYDTIFAYDKDTLGDNDTYDGIWFVPLTAGDAYDRIDSITAEVRRLSALIDRAQRQRHYFDCGPIINYFKTPYGQRGEIDLMAVAPFFLQRLQVYVDISIADIWRYQGQRIISQTAEGDNLTAPVAEEEKPKRRGLFGRVK